MARTKASVGAKVSFGKSTKAQKVTVQPSSSSSGKSKVSSKNSWSGGNAYCPRETPNWQLPITRFFGDSFSSKNDGSSGSCHHELRDKTNLNCSDVESDDDVRVPCIESEVIPENARLENTEDLNRTCSSDTELLPLTEDPSSHKIGEYFESNKPRNEIADSSLKVKFSLKNKGIGKSSKNKNNSLEEDEPMKDVAVEKENLQPATPQRKRSIEDSDENDEDVNSVKRLKISS